jgi:uncharacterized protein
MEEDNLPKPEVDYPKREIVIIIAVFFESGLAPFSLLVGWLLGHPPLATFEWSVDGALWGMLATIPLFLMFLGVLRWPIGPLGRVKEFCDTEVVPLLQDSSWSDIGLVSLSAGVGEEMLFRGVLQPWLTGWLQSFVGNWWGVPCGLALTSVFFGIVHPISIPYIVMAAILGLYLGTAWIVAGNLLTVMIIHALYDFAALSYLLHIRPSGGISSRSS